jgi:hypothetical protein
MRNDFVRQAQLHQRDKANGVKHTPLHTLQECCEAAGIDPRVFGRYAAQYPDAPKPVLQHDKTAWRAGKKYYRKHEFVQWVNEVRKQKEKVMPDIKTALEKALAQTANAWAADDEAHQKIQPQQEKPVPKKYFQTTNNVTRVTFDCVRDNPGMTRVEVAREMAKQGFNSKSVSSLLGQMLRQGMMRENSRLLYANTKEYTPIKARSTKKAKPVPDLAPAPAPMPERKKVTIVNTRTGEVINPKPAGIASLPATQMTTALYTTPVEKPWEPSDVIDKLSLRQAHALFKELRNIFVG